MAGFTRLIRSPTFYLYLTPFPRNAQPSPEEPECFLVISSTTEVAAKDTPWSCTLIAEGPVDLWNLKI
jgi:hypothetical protein